MKICRSYTFEAAHFLPCVPDGHKCKRMHGHNYRIEIAVDGLLDSRGFVVDFAELDDMVMPLIAALDHRMLNDVIENPTAEFIALWFLDHLPMNRTTVRVYENDRSYAEISK